MGGRRLVGLYDKMAFMSKSQSVFCIHPLWYIRKQEILNVDMTIFKLYISQVDVCVHIAVKNDETTEREEVNASITPAIQQRRVRPARR